MIRNNAPPALERKLADFMDPGHPLEHPLEHQPIAARTRAKMPHEPLEHAHDIGTETETGTGTGTGTAARGRSPQPQPVHATATGHPHPTMTPGTGNVPASASHPVLAETTHAQIAAPTRTPTPTPPGKEQGTPQVGGPGLTPALMSAVTRAKEGLIPQPADESKQHAHGTQNTPQTEREWGRGQEHEQEQKHGKETAHQTGKQAAETETGRVRHVEEKGAELAHHVTEQAQGTIQPIVHQATETVQHAKQAVQHAAQQFVAGVEHGVVSITAEVESVSSSVVEKTQHAVQVAKQEMQQVLPDTSTFKTRTKHVRDAVMSVPSRVGSMLGSARSRVSTLPSSLRPRIPGHERVSAALGSLPPRIKHMMTRTVTSVRSVPSRIKHILTHDHMASAIHKAAQAPVTSTVWLLTSLLLNALLPVLFLPTAEAKAVLLTFMTTSAAHALIGTLFGWSSRVMSLSTLPYIPLLVYMWDAKGLPHYYGTHQVHSSSVQDWLHKVRVQVMQEPSDLFSVWIHANTAVNATILVLSGLSLLSWAVSYLIPTHVKGQQQPQQPSGHVYEASGHAAAHGEQQEQGQEQEQEQGHEQKIQ